MQAFVLYNPLTSKLSRFFSTFSGSCFNIIFMHYSVKVFIFCNQIVFLTKNILFAVPCHSMICIWQIITEDTLLYSCINWKRHELIWQRKYTVKFWPFDEISMYSKGFPIRLCFFSVLKTNFKINKKVLPPKINK